MAEKKGLNFDQRQYEALTDMIEDGEADSFSEAARQALTVGLVEMGRLNGRTEQPGWVWMTKEIGKLLVYVGVAWLGFTLFYPVNLRVWTVFFFLAAAGFFVVAEAADRGYIAKSSTESGGEKPV